MAAGGFGVGSPAEPPAIAGLDHIPVAVGDLEAAAGTYRSLGFTLKPGRVHENGIQNQHAKFPDGTEIELLSAPYERDTLTRRYRTFLAGGDGPAFLAFFAPDLARLGRVLTSSGRSFKRTGATLDLDDQEGLDFIFFGGRNASPGDRPEHFAHANRAEALIGVWLAGADLSHERALLTTLGARLERREVRIPQALVTRVFTVGGAEVVLLPASHQRSPGRRIVGATLRVRGLEQLRGVLAQRGWKASAEVTAPDSMSLFLSPELAHGLWLEFRSPR